MKTANAASKMPTAAGTRPTKCGKPFERPASPHPSPARSSRRARTATRAGRGTGRVAGRGAWCRRHGPRDVAGGHRVGAPVRRLDSQSGYGPTCSGATRLAVDGMARPRGAPVAGPRSRRPSQMRALSDEDGTRWLKGPGRCRPATSTDQSRASPPGMSHRAACGQWREPQNLVGQRSPRVPAPYAVHAIAEGSDVIRDAASIARRRVRHLYD
jgi:hypothetical protein